jgi:hypothetical protein
MPLRDHHHKPLKLELEWQSFHNTWATLIALEMNHHLPEGFRAAPNAKTGIEIDVATYGGTRSAPPPEPTQHQWEGGEAVQTIPFELAGDTTEVLVYGSRDGRYLAGAIELVSEGNKDRAEAREAFVAKCETFLQQGVGLIILDAVTTRSANLHDELMTRVGPPDTATWGERLYATAYRPMGKNGSARLAIWREAIALGKPLPTMPLWLLYGPVVSVPLEATYEDTFRQLRLLSD